MPHATTLDEVLALRAENGQLRSVNAAQREEIERLRVEIAELKKIEAAARMLSDSLNGGFVVCRRCGDQEDTTDLDFAADLREALKITG
jgi:hypothetical protein